MARSTTLPQRKVIEAKGLVLAADGVPTLQVATQLGVSPDRVRRWRARFEREGVEGVGRVAPGRGRKPWLPAGTVAEIVRLTREQRPEDGSTHWSTRTLAARVGVNRETVRRVWRDHGLKPWRAETFKLSNDPRFEEKLVDRPRAKLNSTYGSARATMRSTASLASARWRLTRASRSARWRTLSAWGR